MSKLDNCLVTEFRMSAKSLLGSSVVPGESARRHVLGWGRGTLGLLHDYSVKAPLYVFLERVQIFIAVLQGAGNDYADIFFLFVNCFM